MITCYEAAKFQNLNCKSKNIHTHRRRKSTRTGIKNDCRRSLILVKYWMPSDAIVSAHRPSRFAAPLLHLPYGTLSTHLPPKSGTVIERNWPTKPQPPNRAPYKAEENNMTTGPRFQRVRDQGLAFSRCWAAPSPLPRPPTPPPSPASHPLFYTVPMRKPPGPAPRAPRQCGRSNPPAPPPVPARGSLLNPGGGGLL